MTTNSKPRPRFQAHRMGTYVRCMGANHTDEGQRGTCSTCLADIVRVIKADGRKRLFDLGIRYTVNDNARYDYACWNHTHQCDQRQALLVQAERDAKIAAGDVAVIGQNVTVIRGRKITKGTSGIVFWVGDDVDWNGNPFAKVGIKTTAGDSIFIKVDYCIAAAQIVADAPAPVAPVLAAPRKAGSHATCTHAATKAARAACRRARG